jgi:hypothetical protein
MRQQRFYRWANYPERLMKLGNNEISLLGLVAVPPLYMAKPYQEAQEHALVRIRSPQAGSHRRVPGSSG